MNYDIKWKDKGVYVIMFNEVNEQFIEYVNGLIIGNEKFEEIKYQVWDFTDVSTYYIDEEKGREIGALDKAASVWNREMKVAVVTENESLIAYTKEYINEIANTSWQCKLYSNIESAWSWVLEN